MSRTSTERLLQQQIQTLFPRLSRHRRRALARWVVGALLAGSANRPALAPARATPGIARAATLADAWDAGIAAPAHLMNTADPTAAGARRRSIRALACGADLRRGMRAHATGARGTPLIGALASSCGACASAIGARGNRTGSGCGAGPAARGRPTRRSWR